jgi:hypothetical protein
MQYQLERSPKSSPTVNFCCEIFLLDFTVAVLTLGTRALCQKWSAVLVSADAASRLSRKARAEFRAGINVAGALVCFCNALNVAVSMNGFTFFIGRIGPQVHRFGAKYA